MTVTSLEQKKQNKKMCKSPKNRLNQTVEHKSESIKLVLKTSISYMDHVFTLKQITDNGIDQN